MKHLLCHDEQTAAAEMQPDYKMVSTADEPFIISVLFIRVLR